VYSFDVIVVNTPHKVTTLILTIVNIMKLLKYLFMLKIQQNSKIRLNTTLI